jgi:hypothetical protein
LVRALLRYNFHTIKFIQLKYTIHRVVRSPQSILEHFHYPRKMLYHLTSHSSKPPDLGNHYSTFHLYGFAYSGCFI